MGTNWPSNTKLGEPTQDWVSAVLSEIAYKDQATLVWERYEGPIQRFEWRHQRPDRDTGVVETGYGGWRYFNSGKITEEGLVRMVFAAALALEEHETREFFRYRGKLPFNPHTSLIGRDNLGRYELYEGLESE